MLWLFNPFKRSQFCNWTGQLWGRSLLTAESSDEIFSDRNTGKKSIAKCTRHTKATIVGRAATQTDNDFVRTAFGGIQNHFAHSECSRANWIAFTSGNAPHASGFAHLHHRKVFLVDPSVARVDLPTERIVRLAFEPGAAAHITNRFCCPLSTVGHRHNFDLRVRHHVEQPLRDVLRDLPRIQCAFEFIRSDKYSHGHNFTSCVRSSS